MNLNLNTQNTVLKLGLDSGISLPIQVKGGMNVKLVSEAGSLVEYDNRIKQWVEKKIEESGGGGNCKEAQEAIMGGSLPDYEVSHLGAAFDGNLCCPVIEGDADYRIDINGDYGTTVSGNITVGTIFKVTGEDDEDDNVFLAPAAMGDDAELLYTDGLSLSLGESGEWLTPHKGKLYKVTSLHILSSEQAGVTLVIPTYEEATEGRSVSEVYKKLDELDVHDENAKHLAQFFGLPEALPSGYEFMTDTEVTDELEDIMQALDPELLQEVEYPEGSGTYITKAQAITAEAMQIINPSQS